MQQNRELLKEIRDNNELSFIPTDVLRAHRGISQIFKFKARNENAINIEEAINIMPNTLYNLIFSNRNNATQRISIGITKRFSEPEEVLNDRDLVDPITGTGHKRVTILIPTNEKVFDDKFHYSNIFKLYPRSSIRKLLDNLPVLRAMTYLNPDKIPKENDEKFLDYGKNDISMLYNFFLQAEG